jgi:hypothetical protein
MQIGDRLRRRGRLRHRVVGEKPDVGRKKGRQPYNAAPAPGLGYP